MPRVRDQGHVLCSSFDNGLVPMQILTQRYRVVRMEPLTGDNRPDARTAPTPGEGGSAAGPEPHAALTKARLSSWLSWRAWATSSGKRPVWHGSMPPPRATVSSSSWLSSHLRMPRREQERLNWKPYASEHPAVPGGHG